MGVKKPNAAQPKRLILAASIAAICGGTALPAMADMETLLDKLRAKGVLSEEEYQEMRTDVRTERRAAALKKAQEEEASAKKAESAGASLGGKFSDGFIWESGDKQNSIQIAGRVHADYRAFDIDSLNANTANGFDIRRAYVGVQGKLYGDWTYEATADIAASTLEYAWLNYKWSDSLHFRMGAFKMPFSYEELTSSRFIDFQERSLVNAFAPAKDVGFMVHGELVKNTLVYAVALANGAGKNADEANSQVDDQEIIARLASNLAPLAGLKETVLHVGGGYTTGNIPGNTALTGGIRTEGRGLTFLTVSAPPGAAASSDTQRDRLGLETVLAWGPVKAQGEWVKASYDNSSVNYDREIDAYYAELNWLITGEKYADFYTMNGMRAIKPNRPFKKGAEGMGAWEIGARHALPLRGYKACSPTRSSVSGFTPQAGPFN
jgi:phosphate-selective porin OprO/OprP